MQVGKDWIVTLDYRVSDEEGAVVDDGAQPLVYLHGAEDGLFPRLQAALEGKLVGDSVQVVLAPEDAFGPYDQGLVKVERRGVFDADLELGAMFEATSESAPGVSVVYAVVDIDDDRVVLDANHPLAGLTLTFDATVRALRPATADEIAAGDAQAD